MAVINGVFGTLLAFVLVRYRFPGRSVMATLVDLPFAIPTLVTGVMLVALYGPSSVIGGALETAGLRVIFTPLGIGLALLVITLPLVVRTVDPSCWSWTLPKRRLRASWAPRIGRPSAASSCPRCDRASRPGPSLPSHAHWVSSARWWWWLATSLARH